jgi:hypothetical protein
MRRAFFFLLTLALLPAASEASTDRPIAVANAGFETAGEAGFLRSGRSRALSRPAPSCGGRREAAAAAYWQILRGLPDATSGPTASSSR